MHTPTKTLFMLAATLCWSNAHAESELQFVDLRVQAGVSQTDGQAGSFTLMAGDIGNKDQKVIEADADMGIVLGLRGTVMETTVKREDTGVDLDLKLGGGAIVGGLGFLISKNAHLELNGGYGQGVGTIKGDTPWEDRDSRYKMYSGELGWFYTFDMGIQFGLIGGYSILKVKYETAGGQVKAEAKGFDGSVSLGFRF